MTVRTITSEPRPSTKHEGWLYSYFNQRTANGGECAVIFTPALRDLVKPGLLFDDSCIEWSDELRASVLSLDFDEQPAAAGVPPEDGWGDPDPILHSANGNGHAAIERAGTRPPATRRREAQQQVVAGAQLPAAYLKVTMETCKCFQVCYSMLGNVNEARRADIAQKIAVTATISYLRAAGIQLDDQDVKAINSY